MTEGASAKPSPSAETEFADGRPLKMLTTAQVRKIDDNLARIGPFGEVRLVKSKGKLRFMMRVDSEDAVGSATEDGARAQ
jgi:hypothetical protein